MVKGAYLFVINIQVSTHVVAGTMYIAIQSSTNTRSYNLIKCNDHHKKQLENDKATIPVMNTNLTEYFPCEQGENIPHIDIDFLCKFYAVNLLN